MESRNFISSEMDRELRTEPSKDLEAPPGFFLMLTEKWERRGTDWEKWHSQIPYLELCSGEEAEARVPQPFDLKRGKYHCIHSEEITGVTHRSSQSNQRPVLRVLFFYQLQEKSRQKSHYLKTLWIWLSASGTVPANSTEGPQILEKTVSVEKFYHGEQEIAWN